MVLVLQSEYGASLQGAHCGTKQYIPFWGLSIVNLSLHFCENSLLATRKIKQYKSSNHLSLLNQKKASAFFPAQKALAQDFWECIPQAPNYTS